MIHFLLSLAFGVCGAAPAVCLGEAAAGFPGSFPAAASPVLANFPMPPVDEIGLWVWRLIGVAAGVIVLLTFVLLVRQVFGRKPTVDDDLRKLRDELAGLAPSQKVDRLIEQLADTPTKAEIEAIKTALPTFATKAEVTERFNALDSHVRGLKHDLRGDLQAMKLDGENLGVELHSELAAGVSAAEARAVRIHDRIDASSAALRTDMDHKVAEVRREIHEMPGKLVSLLRETGAIGGRTAR